MCDIPLFRSILFFFLSVSIKAKQGGEGSALTVESHSHVKTRLNLHNLYINAYLYLLQCE